MRIFLVIATAVFVTLTTSNAATVVEVANIQATPAAHTTTAQHLDFTTQCIRDAIVDGVPVIEAKAGCHRENRLACWDEPKSAAQVAQGADPVEHLCGPRRTAPGNAVRFTAYPAS